MSKLFSRKALAVLAFVFPMAAQADVTGTPTLPANSSLSLDTGAIGLGSTGDILWTGSSITFVGSAKAFDLPGNHAGAYPTFGLAEAQADASAMSSSPIPLATLVVGNLFLAQTNSGNFAKVLITAQSGTSITLEFDTFAAAVANGPVVNALVNNYSNIPPGLPSYGIAPGSLFVIYGTGMSDPGNPVLHTFKDGPLPTTSNHTSIAVTVNGITTNPGIYYTSPGQIAAVLPSSTPTGQGTITVTYNGTASAPAPIVVTASAFGADTLPGSSGVTATDANYNLITPTASASPGQTIVIWGSGLGADTKNDDLTYPSNQDDLKDAAVYIGGVKANVAYAGRSQFPGVDQINVVVPELGAALAAASVPGEAVGHASSGFQGGCGISVAVVAHSIVSNFVTLPVNPGGGVCSDPAFGTTGSSGSGGSGTRKDGFVEVSQATIPSSDLGSDRSDAKPHAQAFTTLSTASAAFTSTTGSSTVGFTLSLGNCFVNYPGALTGNETVTYLDAGASIGLSGGGISTQISKLPGVGSYSAQLTSALTAGTSYTFKGPGGKDVGSFTVSITFPTLLDWTNENSITTVTESQGQAITWTGGEPGTYIFIGGSSSTAGPPPVSITFFCYVPVEDQQFTIPSYVLLTLPKGKGTLGMSNSAKPVQFPSTTGLDSASAQATDTFDTNVTYQ
jgi:uncharacterized protein (TIGR03437 family)